MRRSALLGCVLLLGLEAGCTKDDDDSSSTTGGTNNAGADSGGSTTGARSSTGGDSGSTSVGGDSGSTSVGGSSTSGGSGGSSTGGSGGSSTTTGGSGGSSSGGSGGSSTTGGSGGSSTTTGGSGGSSTTGGSGGSSTGGSGGSSTGGNAGSTTTGGAGTGGDGGAAGFAIRIPTTHILECTGEVEPGLDPTQEIMEADTLCTFEDGGLSGVIYVQATPVSCVLMMSPQPTYEVVAQIMIDGDIEPLPGAAYDYGGNHNNDSLEFEYGGKTYRYYHSSFGFGWRRCQPMDCAQITEGNVTDDGCTCERTHPVVCSPIQEDGTYDPLDVDNFAVCLGDSTCGA